MNEGVGYKKRLLVEYEDLLEKVFKLSTYVNKINEEDTELSANDRLLIKQEEIMMDYLNILRERILEEME